MSIGRVTIRKMIRNLEDIENTIRLMNYRDAEEFARMRALAISGIRAACENLSAYVRRYTYGEITAGTFFKLHPSDTGVHVKRKEGLRLVNPDGTEITCPEDKLAPDQIVYVRVARKGSVSWE